MDDHVFGPVPSRRLGQSLGVNNVPAKTCTYSCVYCQLGAAPQQLKRQTFYEPEAIAAAVREAVEAHPDGDVDYITFVPDGEPTLDRQLGKTIRLLQPLGIPVAVISNGSLLWQKNVREALLQADWVSIKVDAVSQPAWQQINRPHGDLNLISIRQGWKTFAGIYDGTLTTETMLVQGVNDSEKELHDIAACIAPLQPSTAYLAVPTRPPALAWVQPPGAATRAMAYQTFKEQGLQVEELTGYSPEGFAAGGDIAKHIRAILAVHPMREQELQQLLADSDADWHVIEKLLNTGDITTVAYHGQHFYVKTLPGVTREGDDD